MSSAARSRASALWLGALVALLPATALAQEGALEGVGVGVGGFGVWDWVVLAVRLGLVLVVIWLAVMAMRWYVRRVNGIDGGASGRQLQVLETKALAPNRSLHLVRVGNRAVLLGVTPERINQLTEIDDPEEVERLVEAAAEREGSPRSLRAIVGGIGDTLARARAPRRDALEAPAAGEAGAAEELRAMGGYRRARLTEIQQAIARAREGSTR